MGGHSIDTATIWSTRGGLVRDCASRRHDGGRTARGRNRLRNFAIATEKGVSSVSIIVRWPSKAVANGHNLAPDGRGRPSYRGERGLLKQCLMKIVSRIEFC